MFLEDEDDSAFKESGDCSNCTNILKLLKEERDKNKELLQLNFTLQRILHYNDETNVNKEVSIRRSMNSETSRNAPHTILDITNKDRESSPYSRDSSFILEISPDVRNNSKEISRRSEDSITSPDISRNTRSNSPCSRNSSFAHELGDIPENSEELSRHPSNSQTSSGSHNCVSNNNGDILGYSWESEPSNASCRRSEDTIHNRREILRLSGDSQSSETTSQSDAANDNEEELTDGEPKGYEKLYYYKPKLYRLYKSKGVLSIEDSTPREANQRYAALDDSKIYLGQNFSVGKRTWKLINKKKKEAFFRELSLIIWKKRDLANRCLDLEKTSKRLPNRSPMKLLSPKKLNLFLVLVEDYVKGKAAFAHLTDDQRDIIIRQSTTNLTNIIRDLKRDSN